MKPYLFNYKNTKAADLQIAREESLLILGAGNHGRVVADAAVCSGHYKKIAFLYNGISTQQFNKHEILGDFEDCEHFLGAFDNAVVALEDRFQRMKWLDRLNAIGFFLPAIIHPSSFVSDEAFISEGSVILSGAAVMTGTRIGRGCIINILSSIDHDCEIGDGVHIFPGVHIVSTVRTRDDTSVCTSAKSANTIQMESYLTT